MPFLRLALCFGVSLLATVTRAQPLSVPNVVSSLPGNIPIGPAGLTLDLRDYFFVPGLSGGPIVQFDTVFGRFNVELFSNVAPRHVANFLAYVESGVYTNSFIHRAASFDGAGVSILQGGALRFTLPFQVAPIPQLPPVPLEYNLPNTRGTLAAARSSDPNSATSEWFFNVRDNSTALNQNSGGGYTVFGRILGTGIRAVDSMAVLPRINAGAPLTELPVRAVDGATYSEKTLAVINSVIPVSLFPTSPSPSVITFSVENSDPSVARGTISGTSLTIVALAKGMATTRVRATDTNGNSATLTLTATLVEGSPLPVFTVQPESQAVVPGTTVVLRSSAIDADSYRWEHNSVTVPGATGDTLVISQASNESAGTYVSVATNSSGTVRSSPAILTLVNSPGDPGRLVNLSILTSVGSGSKVLTMGAYIGPGNATGTLPLVVRAVGPTLGQTPFNLAGVLPDPMLAFFAAGNPTPLETNDDWGGGPTMEAAFNLVAAFRLPTSSRDSAILRQGPGVAPGGYTMQVTSKDTSTGACIAEIYDASGGTRTASTPRLMNLSTLVQIDPGSDLAVGFVLGGNTPRAILVRGVGPSLAAFGLGGLMENPQLDLFNNRTGQLITSNGDWGGSAELTTAFSTTGAFALRSNDSKDAALVITLPPGPYSARISGVSGAGGLALVEVYEIP